ncbi:hypothetical protein T4A_9636 [Trichinella pseudospiralis]|uniref:Uncharacterized protein n=1 Tax=Trichinella pseudospiralis TaxID=6337 RepID=A0A0V1DWK3_TRIPS|nr:hypothetical protein T4A_9636 [Trichinella pseudospiralis]
MGVVLISFQYLCPNAKKYMPQISAFAIDTSTLLAFVRFLARLSNNPMHHCDSTRCLICLLITLNIFLPSNTSKLLMKVQQDCIFRYIVGKGK